MKIMDFLIDIVFPRRCPVCHDIVKDRGELICRDCEGELNYVKGMHCMKCGKPIKNPERLYCFDCEKREMGFDENRAVFIYDDVMRKSIYRFKYGGRREYAKFYAQQINKELGRKIKKWNPEVIIPIPLHKSKYKKRGYNQTLLIAKELSHLLNIPVDDKVLIRTKKTEIQKNLSSSERSANLKNAFKMRPNKVQYISAMLVDDIYTTGATMSNAASALKDKGVQHVFCVSLSIGRDI